jgi:hypothetical protein
MSKMAAIDVAVRHQLASEGKEVTYQRVMGTNPAGGYGYDRNGIQLFLLNVANRVTLDVPELQCRWNALDYDRCLEGTLALLIFHVASATSTPTKPGA